MLSSEQQKLVEDNVKLVSFYLKFRNIPWDEDLFQAGCVGLCKAAAGYDPSKGASFATYALRCIMSAVSCEFPRSFIKGKGVKIVSLDKEVSFGDENLTLLDYLPSNDMSIEDLSVQNDIILELVLFLNSIKKRDKLIFIDYHVKKLSQKEIAKKHKIEQPTVSRIIKKINKEFIIYYEKEKEEKWQKK